MRRGRVRYCFLVRNQKQKTLGGTVVVCFFFMFYSKSQTRCISIISKASFRPNQSIFKPSRNKVTKYKLFGIRTWVFNAQRYVCQAHLQRFQDQIHDLITNRHVTRANNTGKENIVMIMKKNTMCEGDEFYEHSYYVTIIQRQFITRR